MPNPFDNKSIAIPCPSCHQKNEKTIGWIKVNDSFVCTCGVTINLSKDDFVGKLAEVERQLNAIPRKITINI